MLSRPARWKIHADQVFFPKYSRLRALVRRILDACPCRTKGDKTIDWRVQEGTKRGEVERGVGHSSLSPSQLHHHRGVLPFLLLPYGSSLRWMRSLRFRMLQRDGKVSLELVNFTSLPSMLTSPLLPFCYALSDSPTGSPEQQDQCSSSSPSS